MRRHVLIVTIAVFLLVPSLGAAQPRLTGADLQGTVVDQSGGVVINADHRVTSVRDERRANGGNRLERRYSVPALPPGNTPSPRHDPASARRVREDVDLFLGESVTHRLRAEHCADDSDGHGHGGSPRCADEPHRSCLDRQSAADRHVFRSTDETSSAFAVITPGVSTDRTPQQGPTLTSGLSFTGQRARSNNIMVDGLDNNDLVVGAVRAIVQPGSGPRVSGLANSYSAEFGKASGGVVNIVTKSGTNTLRGNAYLYFRDKQSQRQELLRAIRHLR